MLFKSLGFLMNIKSLLRRCCVELVDLLAERRGEGLRVVLPNFTS
jgi:hypothetical protein